MKTVEDVIKIAKTEVGVKEVPSGSNQVKYNTWYYGKTVKGKDYPWCMAFVQWVYYKAGVKLLCKTASCTELTNKYKAAKQWFTYGFKPGDIIMFDFSGKKKITQHVGICIATDPIKCTVTCIEGNTSLTSQDNGGAVMVRVRSVKLITGACRPTFGV